LGVKYGSIHNSFSTSKDIPPKSYPEGIAHFLEHKLFINEDGSDSFERFSEYGADANAYTSFNKTAYLFSCTDNFESSLSELLEFVFHPYFTQSSVNSEVGIISEEIRMYDDNPSDRCFYGMLEGMYESHSIRKNICGSIDSISKITADMLYECHKTFYNPSNMALVICGNITSEDVFRICDLHLPKHQISSEIILDNIPNEKPDVFKKVVERKMQVAKPLFNIGFKDTNIPSDPILRQKKDAGMAILDEILFSRAGELYNYLFESQLISPGWSYGYTISENSAYNSIAGEADDPNKVLCEIKKQLSYLLEKGLSYEDFIRGKRVMYSEFVKSFDSVDSIANNLLSFFCEDAELLSYAEIIDSISFEYVNELFTTSFEDNCITLSVIYPTQN